MNINVDQALYNQVKEVASALGCKVSYPNRVLSESDKGTLFLVPTILTSSNNPIAINENCNNFEVGVLTINIFAQANKDLKEVYDALDEIKTKFRRDTTLTFNGQVVRIRSNKTAPYLSDPDWFQQPIDISYRAETPN